MKELKFILTIDGQPIELQYSPVGWKEELIRLERSMTYFGMFRTFSVPLKFVKDGAYLLRDVFYTEGTDAKVYITILKLDKINLIYGDPIEGEIDFSTFKDSSTSVEVTIIEGGISAMVKLNEKTIYEITIPEDDVLNYSGVHLDAEDIELGKEDVSNWIAELEGELGDPQEQAIPVEIVTFENITQDAVQVQAVPGPMGEQWFIQANRTVFLDLTFRGNWNYTDQNDHHSDTGTFYHKLLLRKTGSDDDLLQEQSGEVLPLESVSESMVFTESRAVLRLDPGETFTLIAQVWSTVIGSCDSSFSEVTITCRLYAQLPPIELFVMPADKLFKALVEKMTGGQFEGESQLLTNLAEPMLITSGEAVRMINGPVIKTSLKDFFTSILSVFDIGMGVETIEGVEKLIIETKDYFFSLANIFNVGLAKNYKISVATDLLYNTIKCGYPNQEYGKQYGRDEFNSIQNWKLPIERVVNSLSIESVYRADMYGIDNLRLFFAEDATADTKEDNKIFMISSSKIAEGQYELLREPYNELLGYVTGLQFPFTAYNIDYSPKRNLLRRKGFLRSILFPLEARTITFLSGEKNVDLVSFRWDGNNEVRERDNFTPFGDVPRLFIPYYLEFECSYYDLSTFVEKGQVEVTIGGTAFKGFVIYIEMKAAGRGSLNCKLLLGPDNATKLKDLIR